MGLPKGELTAQGAASREAILDAAAAEFSARGYAGASLRGIAERAGISKAGMLHHFPDKAALLTGVLSERTADKRHPELVREDFKGLWDRYAATVTINHDDTDWMRFFTLIVAESLTQDHPAAEAVRRRYARTVGVGAEELRLETPWLSDEQAHVISALGAAVLDGLQIQALVRDDFDMRVVWREFDTMAQARLESLRPSPASE